MKNYYDELEISKNASKEVIEKVYKVLAKKYHPDTTKEIDKIAAEEKFKIISEAYEILSNDEKRKKYDLELQQSNPTVSYEDYLGIVKERDSLNFSLNSLKHELNQLKNSNAINSIPYNQTSNNFNTAYSNNNATNYQNPIQNQSTQTTSINTNNTNGNKKTYYYTNTGKPASAFSYYKYKIKEFFSNIMFFLLLILALLLFINTFLNLSLFNFILK